MANWYGTCRSNYFRVKDDAAFTDFLAPFEVDHITKTLPDGVILHGFISISEDGGVPQYWPEDAEGVEADEPVTLTDVIGEHLPDNEVALIMEIGAEKARYLSGYAWAISNTGDKFIDLHTAIMEAAYVLAPAAVEITPVEY